jgi:hypothetical protein
VTVLPAALIALAIGVVGIPASAVAAGPAPADARTVRPLSAHGPLGTARLSDERRVTRFARAVARARVRVLPIRQAAAVGRLRYLTEDGPDEIYPVLESYVDAGARTWLRVRLPARPNGQSGWVPRNDLGTLHAVRTMLRVNRATLRATLYRDGRTVWSSPIGVGTQATPTPAGHFWIRSRLRDLRHNSAYGPYAFGTAAYSVLSDWPGGGVIGIHGTDRPELIPGRPSHGCIRVPNAAITRLWQLMGVGTPVEIL